MVIVCGWTLRFTGLEKAEEVAEDGGLGPREGKGLSQFHLH